MARTMNALTLSVAVVVMLALGCTARQGATPSQSSRHYASTGAQEGSQPGTGLRYLGIPPDEEYPHTKFQLDDRVPRNKYFRVSRIQQVTKDQYEYDVARGRTLFRERHGDREYYATEFSGDFDQQPGVRAWVTILQRKVYP